MRRIHFRELRAPTTACGLPGALARSTTGPIGVTCLRCQRLMTAAGETYFDPPQQIRKDAP